MAQRRWASSLAAGMLLLAGGASWSQGLLDPTRPPAGFYVSAGPARPGSAAGGLVLQSVLIHPDARSAIINGEHIAVGQKIGELRLVKVAETEVVLLEGGERRTLRLFPGIEKRPAGQHQGRP